MQATALYRHFDREGQLLYVGISMCAFQRSRQHRHSAAWFTTITRIEIEWFESRAAAEVAEYQAIKREHPLHNGTFNGKTPAPDEPIHAIDEHGRKLTHDIPIRPTPKPPFHPRSAIEQFPNGKRKIMSKSDVQRVQRERLGRTSFC